MSIDLRDFRGWSVEYIDGTVVYEGQTEWRKLPKNNIKVLSLHYDLRRWDIVDKSGYIQKKRCSISPFVDCAPVVESRSIGYYENGFKVWYTVNENTGKMTLQMEKIK